MTAAVTHLHSVQGEQARRAATSSYREMDYAAVERYVDQASPEVLECRAGNHDYREVTRKIARGDLGTFDRYNDELDLWELHVPCACCRLAYQIRYFQQLGTARNPQFKPFGTSQTRYKTGPNGERYTADPGQGRISPRQINGILVTNAMQGMTLVQIKRETMRQENK